MPTTEELLAAVVGHGMAAVPATELAERWGWSLDELDQAAESLTDHDILSWWEECPECGPALVLSAASAERLGLTLDDDGKRWASRDAKPKPIVANRASSREVRESDLTAADADRGFLDGMIDRRGVEAPDVAERHEDDAELFRRADEAAATLHRSNPVRAELMSKARGAAPLLLLGLGATWPVEFEAGSRCRCCRGAKGFWVCLVCNSSSLDGRIGKPPSAATLERQAVRAMKAEGKALAGGLGRTG